ncbi:class I SAM-dependent methyltransferase [Acinetobacter sp. ANC 5378]|uniref:class I SAM-dependent methyltransferase n=1 Tax=Acinetobacter sp. ANC 5378 TaxID=2731249 RepID=UPI00149014FC|nr:class I SAM-dependent methyltransferase [Acinetobacter sp. ANC 5378]NNG81043.1 methyltransferase domain-containing protein [Acinetobacter sp. ANC 5378]
MKDLFSNHSLRYKQARPNYSIQIVQEILKHVPERNFAWDCGAGSGQFTQLLAPYFDHVVATDISEAQLQQAPYFENVSYQVQAAEQTSIPAQSIDLVTVAQAIHWFDFDAFYTEVKRVLKPQGVFAAIGYGLIEVQDAAINSLVQQLYFDTLNDYWDSERRYIDELYQTIPFPFNEQAVAEMYLQYQWSPQQLLNYLKTWSALKHYQDKNAHDPLQLISNALQAVPENLDVTFPVLLRIGMREK